MKNIVCPTIILKRIEVFFLREWIEHHIKLGVDKFMIYDNGFQPTCAHKSDFKGSLRQITSDEKSSGVWTKKPDVNYHFDLSDSQIDDALRDIEKDFNSIVEIVPWVYGVNHNTNYPFSQGTMFSDCMRRYPDGSQWAHLCIDPDEFIVLYKDKNLKDLFKYGPEWKNHLCFQERIFAARESGKPVRSIFNYEHDAWTRTKFLSPAFYWPGQTIISVHRVYPKKWMMYRVEPDVAKKYHYIGAAVSEYANCAFSNIDKTMEKYI
tara:strand:+ start:3370 stop:4161 length:792 start_codon:yes stop_codon:yes gene_type:complete